MNNENKAKKLIIDVALNLTKQMTECDNESDFILYQEAYNRIENVLVMKRWFDEYKQIKEKEIKPVVSKGKLIFQFDYEIEARSQFQIEHALKMMFDFWYDSQEDALRENLEYDIRDKNVKLDIKNATVTIEN